MRKITFDIIRFEWTTTKLINFADYMNIDVKEIELNKPSTKRKLANLIWDKINNHETLR